MTDADILVLRALLRSREPIADYPVMVAVEQALKEVDRLRHCALLIASQAVDENLWFNAGTSAEAYLQRELRKLHALIEGA